jgi:hypothetical protein
MTTITTQEVSPAAEDDPCCELADAECEPLIADPLRAALAELGGRAIRQVLWELMPVPDPTLAVSYGRVFKFADHDAASLMWFQPADGSGALHLVIPNAPREAAELTWAACDWPPFDRVVITAQVPEGSAVPGRVDAMLVAVALSVPEDFGCDVTVATNGCPYGILRSHWPERIVLPGPVIEL